MAGVSKTEMKSMYSVGSKTTTPGQCQRDCRHKCQSHVEATKYLDLLHALPKNINDYKMW